MHCREIFINKSKKKVYVDIKRKINKWREHTHLPTCIRPTKQLPVKKTYVLVWINDNIPTPGVDHTKAHYTYTRLVNASTSGTT